MPKITKPKTNGNIIKDRHETRQIEKLAEVLWKSGSIDTPFCQAALKRAKLSEITPAMLLKAQAINEERWRANFQGMNDDPKSPLKVVVSGDPQFDPALNPKHSIKGAAAAKETEKLVLISNAGNTPKEESKKETKVSRTEGEPSNKEIVYKAWKAGTTDIAQLLALVKTQVKEGTIKSWIGSWVKNKNLPACAKG